MLLEPTYPVILIDVIVVRICDGAVANRPVYVATGITLDGVLTCWECRSDRPVMRARRNG